MDPTSGLFAGEGHIPLSATPHPTTAAAITGSTGIAQTTLEYSNVVRRIQEDPRVTLPYTPAQWAAVQSVGALVDKRLEAGDVRMTMGGEPTFVSDRRRHLRRVDDRRGRPEEAGTGRRAGRAAAQDLRPRRCRAPRSGQVVPGRTVAALADCHALAGRRGAAVVRSGVARRPVGRRGAAESAEPGRAAEAGDSPVRNWPAPSSAAVAEYFELPASQVRPAYEDALGKLAQQVRMPAGEPVADDLDEDSPDARTALLQRAGRVGHRAERLRAAAAPAGRARRR